MSIRSFEELECWKAGREFRKYVSAVIKQFPKEEMYQLTAQMKNASRSVTHNIAEGYGRYHYLDNAKFCSNARGSLFEVLDQLITANDEGYISNEEFEQGRVLFEKTLKLLNGYIKYLKTNSENKVGESEMEYNSFDPNN